MPVCCRCNGNGRCTNCVCSRAGAPCQNCLPSRRGRCNNALPTDIWDDSVTAAPNNNTSASAQSRRVSQVAVDSHLLDNGDTHQQSNLHSSITTSSPTPSLTLCPESTTAVLQTETEMAAPLEGTQNLAANPDANSAELNNLPTFTPIVTASFKWGEKDGDILIQSVDTIYNETVHWKRNLFKTPSGKAGRLFVQEITRLLTAFSEKTALEGIAMKAAMIMPALLLQNPHQRSNSKQHSALLERRLKLWSQGDMESLLNEGRTIQQEVNKKRGKRERQNQDVARSFAKQMMEGKVKAAMRSIENDSSGGQLQLNATACPSNPATVREVLKEKHPQRCQPNSSAIITAQATEPHPILYDKIDGHLIHSIALKMDGSAGPSGLDVAAWKRLCTSYKTASTDLCNALASATRRICTELVDPIVIMPLVACRLIALDKCPGVRPIGVGETMRRIMNKTIATVLRDEIQEAAGPLQVCAGQIAGCEAAIHAMRRIHESQDTEAVILADASNAFNSLNCEVALRNISHLCPSLSKALINTYREDIPLYIDGETTFSQEGTTQGDPLAMAMYAIAITPLINRLKEDDVKQIWYADDAAAGGKLSDLKTRWDRLVEIGPDYGYYPNASKTWLIVKEHKHSEAVPVFEGTEIVITTDGKRHLGAAIGTRSFIEKYAEQKIAAWIHEVETISSLATTQPHAAYAAFTRGLANKWTFLARTIPDTNKLFEPLEEKIRTTFLPALTGQDTCNGDVRDLLALPVRLGGLGIVNPSKQATLHQNASEKITTPLTDLILAQSQEYTPQVKAEQIRAKKSAQSQRRQSEKLKASEISEKLPCNPSKIDEDFNRKGRFKLALHTTHPRTWLRTPQGCIPRRTLPTLWMATKTPSFPLCLWQQIHC